MKNAKPNPGAVPGTYDVTLRSLDAGNTYVGVAVIRRVQAEDKDALVHANVTEIYEMTEGSGTIELGGTLVGGKPFAGGSGPSAIGPAQEAPASKAGTPARSASEMWWLFRREHLIGSAPSTDRSPTCASGSIQAKSRP